MAKLVPGGHFSDVFLKKRELLKKIGLVFQSLPLNGFLSDTSGLLDLKRTAFQENLQSFKSKRPPPKAKAQIYLREITGLHKKESH